jgi:hypothetical protein
VPLHQASSPDAAATALSSPFAVLPRPSGWIVLKNARPGAAGVDMVVLRPDAGVILLDLDPHWTPDAVSRLRGFLDGSGFAAAHPGHLPIVHRRFRAEDLLELEELLSEALLWQEPIGVAPGWDTHLVELLRPRGSGRRRAAVAPAAALPVPAPSPTPIQAGPSILRPVLASLTLIALGIGALHLSRRPAQAPAAPTGYETANTEHPPDPALVSAAPAAPVPADPAGSTRNEPVSIPGGPPAKAASSRPEPQPDLLATAPEAAEAPELSAAPITAIPEAPALAQLPTLRPPAATPQEPAPAPDPIPEEADAPAEIALAAPPSSAAASRSAPPVQPAAIPPALLTTMLRRAEVLLAQGDISGARRFLERAALAGHAPAAFALAETHDPRWLAAHGARGILADPEAAGRWYRRAAELGLPEATARISGMEAR